MVSINRRVKELKVQL